MYNEKPKVIIDYDQYKKLVDELNILNILKKKKGIFIHVGSPYCEYDVKKLSESDGKVVIDCINDKWRQEFQEVAEEVLTNVYKQPLKNLQKELECVNKKNKALKNLVTALCGFCVGLTILCLIIGALK